MAFKSIRFRVRAGPECAAFANTRGKTISYNEQVEKEPISEALVKSGHEEEFTVKTSNSHLGGLNVYLLRGHEAIHPKKITCSR